MGIETVIVFAAGAATIIGIILAVRVFVEIIEIRDIRRTRYRAVRSEGQGGPPGHHIHPALAEIDRAG